MPYEFYKVMHIAGVFLILSGVIGMIAVKMIVEKIPDRSRRLFFLMHGFGMLLSLVGGFGLAARLGYVSQLPQWIWVKLCLWLFFGAAIAIAKRKGQIGGPLVMLCIGLAIFGSWLAVNKPF
jgi:hypothetical protein